jgi:hypothetical protein
VKYPPLPSKSCKLLEGETLGLDFRFEKQTSEASASLLDWRFVKASRINKSRRP